MTPQEFDQVSATLKKTWRYGPYEMRVLAEYARTVPRSRLEAAILNVMEHHIGSRRPPVGAIINACRAISPRTTVCRLPSPPPVELFNAVRECTRGLFAATDATHKAQVYADYRRRLQELGQLDPELDERLAMLATSAG